MNSVKLFDTQSKYFLKQKQDIAKYGKKGRVKRFGVPFALIQELTPNRRLSKKPIKLSDPQYFIDKYEKQNPHITKIVLNWNQLSDAEKVDYIVKEKYSELVINKIMNKKIKDLELENSYSLNMDGEIVSLDKGISDSVNLDNYINWFFYAMDNKLLNENMLSSRSVHNHTPSLEGLTDYIMKNHPKDINKFSSSFSHQDIGDCYGFGEISYLIDSYNHKYKYTPFRKFCFRLQFVTKVKAFLEKQHNKLNAQKTQPEIDLDEFLSSNHNNNDDKIEFQQKIYEGFYKLFMHDTKNIHAETDQIYALSDYGNFELLK